MSDAIPRPSTLEGEDLRAAFAASANYLRDAAAAIDAINVYPVPDGDTGSNMSATLDRAVEQAAAVAEPVAAPAVLKALARGALYGARAATGA